MVPEKRSAIGEVSVGRGKHQLLESLPRGGDLLGDGDASLAFASEM